MQNDVLGQDTLTRSWPMSAASGPPHEDPL